MELVGGRIELEEMEVGLRARKRARRLWWVLDMCDRRRRVVGCCLWDMRNERAAAAER